MVVVRDLIIVSFIFDTRNKLKSIPRCYGYTARNDLLLAMQRIVKYVCIFENINMHDCR